MKTLVIIPAYNEQGNIIDVVKRLQKAVPEMDYLIVDDCSKDNTANLCKEHGCSYLSLPVNLGIGGGMQTGYKYALENGYEIAVQHDGDGQHDPAYIRQAVEPIAQNRADIVIGSRFLSQEGFQSSKARRAGIRLLSALIYLCCKTRIKDVTSGFRAVNREYIQYYAKDYPTDYPEPEAIVMASLNGARICEIPVIMHGRSCGASSITRRKSVYYMVKVSVAVLVCRLMGRRE